MNGTLYVIHGCDMCEKAKIYLRSLDMSLDIVNIMDHPESAKNLQKYIGDVSAPVLVAGNQVYVKHHIFRLEESCFDR